MSQSVLTWSPRGHQASADSIERHGVMPVLSGAPARGAANALSYAMVIRRYA